MPRTSVKLEKTNQSNRLGRPTISLKLDGNGVTPERIPLRKLAEILAATAASFEAVAKEFGRREPQIALTAIVTGSAGYDMLASEPTEDDEFRAVSSEFKASLETDPESLRASLKKPFVRLSNSAKDYTTSLTFSDPQNTKKAKTLPIPSPSTYQVSYIEGTNTLYGQVWGVERLKSRYSVMFRVEDGPKLELDASESMAARAASLFNKFAEAKSVCVTSSSGDPQTWVLESISEWDPSPILQVFSEIGQDLENQGGIDAEEIMRKIREA